MLVEKIVSRLVLKGIRILQQMRIVIFRCLSTAAISGKPSLYQPVQFAGFGKIIFHGKVNIGIFPSPYFLSGYGYIEARNPSASISIGDGTWINNNFVAIAEYKSIVIGNRVLIGHGVEILESDFHGLEIDKRMLNGPENAADIIIEDDVFIGANVKIMKGVTIGAGTVIGNSAVVVHDLPRCVIAAGNPARIIRSL